jgi:predicted unusual protein kinase regulating ubiquinone biosynthesis (AarF/ABC1/UbiB family)
MARRSGVWKSSVFTVRMITLPFPRKQIQMTSPKKYWVGKQSMPASSALDDMLFVLRMLSHAVLAPLHKSFLLGFFENSGYTLLKLGQWASTRHDLFPEKVCRALSSLRERAPTHNASKTYESIRGLDIKLGNLIGSGTVAQVYRSSFKGRDVAVKVLHPDVRPKILKELATLGKIAGILSKVSFLKPYDLKSQFQEFSKGFLAQCDLRSEASNLELLHKLNPNILIPQPLFADENVLVENYIACEDVLHNVDPGFVEKCTDFVLDMITNHRFVHADLHAGNFKKTPQNDIVILDGGLCKCLTAQEQRNLHDLIFALLLSTDGKRAGQLLVERLPKNANVDKASFVRDFESMCQKHIFRLQPPYGPGFFFSHFGFVARHAFLQYAVSVDMSKSKEIVRDFHCVLSRHNVVLDSTYSTLFTSLICLDGALHPYYKFMERGTITRIFLRHVPLVKYFVLDLKSRLRRLVHE